MQIRWMILLLTGRSIHPRIDTLVFLRAADTRAPTQESASGTPAQGLAEL